MLHEYQFRGKKIVLTASPSLLALSSLRTRQPQLPSVSPHQPDYPTLSSWLHENQEMCSPEQELTIEITDVDGVHIDHMDVFEATQSEIAQYFTPKTTSTYA
jgi:hypothetical protein